MDPTFIMDLDRVHQLPSGQRLGVQGARGRETWLATRSAIGSVVRPGAALLPLRSSRVLSTADVTSQSGCSSRLEADRTELAHASWRTSPLLGWEG